jgi:hypothetical protein
MTEQEYNNELNEIEENYKAAKSVLYRKYVKSQVIYNIGDIIRNNVTTIMIEKYSAYVGLGKPKPIYIGIELKKDLSPKKRQEITKIYGNENTEKLN